MRTNKYIVFYVALTSGHSLFLALMARILADRTYGMAIAFRAVKLNG